MSDQNLVNRRDFVKTAGGAVAATSLLGADAFAQAPAGRRRYAIIGTGERATEHVGPPDSRSAIPTSSSSSASATSTRSASKTPRR